MSGGSADVFDGWRRSYPRPRERTWRRRTVIGPLAAILFLAAAHLLFGATQPISALALSICLTAAAVATVALAGPRHVTAGMAGGIVALWIFAATGIAGHPDKAGPELAVLFAAGAMWSVGYVCARSRGALDIAWMGLIWTSLAFSIWIFFSYVAAVFAGDGQALTVGFSSPSEAALVFGLLSLVGWSRVLHIVKKMDAEALAHSAMFDRLMREGLGGILLVAFALTCLAAAGSMVGATLAAAAMLLLGWWETRTILQRQHRGALLKLFSMISPFLALALAGWGIAIAWLRDESVAPGVGVTETLPHLQRVTVYVDAWLQRPETGHGLGSAQSIGDAATTLWNAKAMLAPGEAQNVLVQWLIETGLVGVAAIAVTLTAMHVRIFSGLGERGAKRTMLRLAVAAGFFMLLHGVSDSSLDLPSATWLYALLLGLACGVAARPRKSRSTALQ